MIRFYDITRAPEFVNTSVQQCGELFINECHRRATSCSTRRSNIRSAIFFTFFVMSQPTQDQDWTLIAFVCWISRFLQPTGCLIFTLEISRASMGTSGEKHPPRPTTKGPRQTAGQKIYHGVQIQAEYNRMLCKQRAQSR